MHTNLKVQVNSLMKILVLETRLEQSCITRSMANTTVVLDVYMYYVKYYCILKGTIFMLFYSKRLCLSVELHWFVWLSTNKVSEHPYHSPVDHLSIRRRLSRSEKMRCLRKCKKVTSMNDMMLKPRQRPKIPPREEINSTGPILILLSSSGGGLSSTCKNNLSQIFSGFFH